MFASEKVMLEYLDQLLSEESAEPQPAVQTDDEAQSVAIGSNASKSVAEKLGESYHQAHDKASPRTQTPPPTTSPIKKSRPLLRKAAELSPAALAAKPFKEPDTVAPETDTNSIAKLLQQVSTKQEAKIAKERQKTVDLVRSVNQEVALPETATKVETETPVVDDTKTDTTLAVETPAPATEVVQETFPDKPFQALFFSVAGLSLAVPLQELGGIHKLTELNSLFGKPAWFKGVMLSRGKKLNVVDSARWVMPEKYNKTMEEQLNYQYLIMLGESNWGLAAESLVETESISPDAVKWRKNSHKRPWLMGTIKEKMCALLHVSDLIAMLEQGIDARQE